MRAGFYTLGCKVNQYETQLMREDLIRHGYEIVSEQDHPDVFIINSCTVTAESDRKTRQMVRKYRKALPDAVLVLTGCMPQAFPEEASAMEQADIVLGNASNQDLTVCLDRFLTDRQRIVDLRTHDREQVRATVDAFFEHTKAFLKIQDGCNRFCSYCIIPYARGRIRSKPLEQIQSEVQTFAVNGYREVVLIGINLTSYGAETGLSIADAVETAAAIDGIDRIRLGSMEPELLTDSVIQRLAAIHKLCPQFHLSLQSGCNRTLKAMNRHYDTALYTQIIQKLRTAFADCAITTDVMVGFAGETSEDFEESRRFVEQIGFAKVHVFPYSRRKGTKADTFPNQIDPHTKRQRSLIMRQTAEAGRKHFLQQQLGRVFPVLYENRNTNGFYEGYTPNYTPVLLRCDHNPCGQILPTRLCALTNDGCTGELV